jgi:endo-1,4-beta-xylanase
MNTAAKRAGKIYFGTAVDAGGLNNQQYLSILKNTADFGQITPANAQKVLSQVLFDLDPF